MVERSHRQEQWTHFYGALSESLELLQVGYWQWDIDTDELWWSKEMRSIYGVGGEGAATYREWGSIVHPEDFPEADSATMRMIQTGEPQIIEYRVITNTGEVRWVRDAFTLNDDGKTMVGAVVQFSPEASETWPESFRKKSEREGMWSRERKAVLEAIGLDPAKSYEEPQ